MTADLDILRMITVYTLELREWLDSQQSATESGDFLVGRWVLSGNAGAIEFTPEAFRWYRDPLDSQGDCFIGSWSWMPGIKLSTGFILDHGRDLTSCFSVILRYVAIRENGEESPMENPGLLFVEQADSGDQVIIYNHHTLERYLGSRDGAQV